MGALLNGNAASRVIKRLISVLFAAALASFAVAQAHADVYTLRATGTFYQGTDSQGFFGGGDLTGRSVDFTQLFDTTTSGVLEDAAHSASNLIGPTSFGSLSVGGVALTVLPDTNLGHTLRLANAVTLGGPGAPESISGVTNASYANGVTFTGNVNFESFVNAFLPSRDFSQTLTLHPGAGDSAFGGVQWNKNVGGVNVGTYGYFNIDTLTLNAVNAVPEPETYAMLLAGLGLLGLTARRRTLKAA